MSNISGLALKCIVNGDYSNKNEPKQFNPYEEKIVECPNEIGYGVTYCQNITGKYVEGKFNEF